MLAKLEVSAQDLAVALAGLSNLQVTVPKEALCQPLHRFVHTPQYETWTTLCMLTALWTLRCEHNKTAAVIRTQTL